MGKRTMADVPERFRWLKVGARVDYHSVLGGPVTRENLEVRDPPFPIPGDMRGYRGKQAWCVMVNGKAGWVACEALTPARASGEGGKP